MTKFRILVAFMATFAFFTTSSVMLDAAQHKKHRKVSKKRKVACTKKVYQGAAKYTKNDPTYCNGPTCSLPGGCPTDPAVATQSQPQAPAAAQPQQLASTIPVAPVTPALAPAPQPVVAQPVTVQHQEPVPTQESDDKYNNHLGFYAGFSGSIYQISGEHSVNVTAAAANINNAGFSKVGLSKFSAGADLHAGYLHKMGNWGLGVECYYDPTTLSLTENLNIGGIPQALTLKLKGTLGVAAKVGYFMSPRTLVFGRVGYEQQKMNVTIAGNAINPVNVNQNSSGMTFGFGSRYMLTTSWGLSSEYVYGLYKNKTFSNLTTPNVTTTTIRPTNHAIRFSLDYIF